MSTIKTWHDRWYANDPGCLIKEDAMQAEITELREALKVANEERHSRGLLAISNGIRMEKAEAERDALQAKLSAIEAQEPELWARYPRTGRNSPPEVVTKKPEDADSWVAFYAAPVAPAQPVNELVRALQGAANYIDHLGGDSKPTRISLANAKAAQKGVRG